MVQSFSSLVVVLYLLCLFSNLILALPTSRFNHGVETIASRGLEAGSEATSPGPTHRLRRRGLPGAVYICTKDNFRGDCAWTAPNTRCHISGTGNNSARSIGPDEDGFCVLYEKATCTGTQVKTLRFPGQASNMPAFMSLQCFPDGGGSRASTNATAAVSEAIFGKNEADPRLAGGVGSMERKNMAGIMEQMEKDGFKQGMIGLKKGHYY